MNLSELTRERIQNSDASGCQCRFIRIDDHRGIKFYTSVGARDLNRERQALGAIWGLCPKVYENVDLPNIGYYGFVTEVVKVAGFNMPESWVDRTFKSYTDGFQYGNELAQTAVSELAKRYEQFVGPRLCDLHECNYGFTYDGRLVLLDVGC